MLRVRDAGVAGGADAGASVAYEMSLWILSFHQLLQPVVLAVIHHQYLSWRQSLVADGSQCLPESDGTQASGDNGAVSHNAVCL